MMLLLHKWSKVTPFIFCVTLPKTSFAKEVIIATVTGKLVKTYIGLNQALFSHI